MAIKSKARHDLTLCSIKREIAAGRDVLGNINKLVTFCHRFASIGNMVRNAGQIPQPFWIGAACGGGSFSAARCAART